jgi:hypothetical protein
MIERQGRAFVLYAGLLDEAHQKGLKAIRTRLIQAPCSENGETTICLAEVEMEDGRVFSGIGDATPHNVGRNIAPHAIRMAETRAKARAMRDAINVATVALEELSDDDLDAPSDAGTADRRDAAFGPRAGSASRGSAPTPISARERAAAPPRDQKAARPAGTAPERPATGGSADRGDLATPAQVRAIYLIARDQHHLTDSAVDERSVSLYGSVPAELTRRQASNLITQLKGEAQPAAS